MDLELSAREKDLAQRAREFCDQVLIPLEEVTSEHGELPTLIMGDFNIFGRERWDLTELKKRLGVVSPELPGRPTLHTTGRDAVITGFFSSSTLWPNLTVTEAMRNRADEILGQVDAVVVHWPTAQQRVDKSAGKLQLLATDVARPPLGIAVSRAHLDLGDQVLDAVIALKNDGTESKLGAEVFAPLEAATQTH